MEHQNVKEAAMVVVPNEAGKEVLKAFVVKKNAELKEQEVIAFVSKFGSVKLEGGVEFIEKLPRNPFGKVVRKFLLERNRIRKNT